jgi:hypothetical protein
MYTSSFFHNIINQKPYTYDITPDILQKIKNLRTHRSPDSGYYDDMLQ